MNIFEVLDVGGPAFFRQGLNVSGSISGTGGFYLPVSQKTGIYTATENDYVIAATSGTFTITLPTAAGIAGRMYVFKNNGSGSITVDPAGSETIDGFTTAVLKPGHSCITIQSDGTNWIAIGVISPVQMT